MINFIRPCLTGNEMHFKNHAVAYNHLLAYLG